MKRCYLILLSLIISSASITALKAETELGKIIQLMGDVDITDTPTNRTFAPSVGTEISKYQKIRTGVNSFAEILLNDGNKVFIREASVVYISGLKLRDKDAPGKIEVLTGKVKININRPQLGRTLIIETSTAIIGILDEVTDIAIISSIYETKVVIYEGKADVANIKSEIIKSYTLMKKEEASIKLDSPPSEPVVLPAEILNSWLDYYDIIDSKRIIIRGNKEDSLIDYILRKRDL